MAYGICICSRPCTNGKRTECASDACLGCKHPIVCPVQTECDSEPQLLIADGCARCNKDPKCDLASSMPCIKTNGGNV